MHHDTTSLQRQQGLSTRHTKRRATAPAFLYNPPPHLQREGLAYASPCTQSMIKVKPLKVQAPCVTGAQRAQHVQGDQRLRGSVFGSPATVLGAGGGAPHQGT